MLRGIEEILTNFSLVVAFAAVGAIVWSSNFASAKLTQGRLHGSAIAIFAGLLLAYLGGTVTGGKNGIVDIGIFAGFGLMGGTMLRDLAIVATASGVRLAELRRAGPSGLISILAGTTVSFVVGGSVAYGFGYRDAVSMATIGGGAATYIVGTVTGTSLGASSDVIALSVATGLLKSILVMIFTPVVAKSIGLDNPRSALIFGGLMGTTSGVAGGLVAIDPKLVPYGALTATFYTGIGCLLGPSVVYFCMTCFV